MSKTTKNTYYLGIRHHGVGSSTRLLSALNTLKPTKILIEGASDCSELLPLLAHAQMKPPVALLAYATDYPELHYYYPFAKFSPEYQAVLWAVKHSVEVVFIDLPVSVKLAKQITQIELDKNKEPPTESISDDDMPTVDDNIQHPSDDPIGMLAQLAGYDDGEDWWNDVIEQSHAHDDLDNDLAVFASIAHAMQALRQRLMEKGILDKVYGDGITDAEREAYMRQQITHHQKNTDGDTIVVICGAWHIPALDPNLSASFVDKDGKKIINHKNDQTIIKSLPKKLAASKVKTTWIPWTSPRLASQSGYGAGVKAPMWYLHLWQNRHHGDVVAHWLTEVACLLRQQGHIISTASVIEATRLGQSLAAVRQRPSVGFEELIDSTIACLCFGESLLWHQIADELLLGNQVGQIPNDMPLAPLLEDLQRLQKQTKLTPESLAKEISLDLRTPIGLTKSHLLHRLQILGVPWGEILDSGHSRGTFREKWQLIWQAEFAVVLVENLVYGSTIAQAANNKLSEELLQIQELHVLVAKLQLAMQAGLNKATDVGLEYLSILANQTESTDELLASLPPLIHLERYGTARAMALEQVAKLAQQLTIKVSLVLPWATRQIDQETAERYHHLIKETHHALLLAQMPDNMIEVWWQAIHEIAGNVHQQNTSHLSSHSRLIGLCNRLLYQDEQINSEQLEIRLQKALSPAITTQESAQFFVGFFQGATQNLLHDDLLLTAVKQWLSQLTCDEFHESLPLFRRIFANLDVVERKRLLERVTQGKQQHSYIPNVDQYPIWQQHLTTLSKLLKGQVNWAEN